MKSSNILPREILKHFLPPVNGGKPQENSISVIKRW